MGLGWERPLTAAGMKRPFQRHGHSKLLTSSQQGVLFSIALTTPLSTAAEGGPTHQQAERYIPGDRALKLTYPVVQVLHFTHGKSVG